MPVIDEIAAERRRQVEVEGWTAEHDDQHIEGQLAGAAACYCLGSVSHWAGSMAIKSLWPWSPAWWKPKDRRRDLVRAAALLIAEIERLDRARRRALQEAGDRHDRAKQKEQTDDC